ncbi:DNA polymerase III subunit epsilon [Sphaerotilus montanus]|jgi:DNA polymerase-3 subunit epsilon|uniref:DNA polymerase III subunit epsilon n=1 Tax=Sphaerotilus montanus TaxID=522889 RepID=A0A7Y9R1U5_9BURK|nr:DNA polymerase III subunit epsilon [Sphaerotilus montanus]NYG33422.1 DNA polymerase-3 subunit epsilon [Sphaerotilus montanus]NZD59250.1 DNA polymerase III subunit epsilon [Sphaerotilus montanus]
MRQIFLDTETTGLNPETGDRIVEIGCIEMVSRRLTGRHLHLYLNPERPGSEEATRIHGLTDAFLADKPKFREVAAEFIEFVRGAELIIHNAAFDVGFLNAELRRVQQPRVAELAGGILDTLVMAREQYPGKANSLDALCRRLEVDNTNRTFHGALLDAGLLAEVYIRMTRGQNALVIDADDGQDEGSSDDADLHIDLSAFSVAVLRASEQEIAAHAGVLADLDKASGGKTVWRTISA